MNDNGYTDEVSKGTIANDFAVISQSIGAINEYWIGVDFYTTRRGI